MNVNTKNDDTGVVKGDFKQCVLVRTNEVDEVISTVSLIPLRLCKIGKKIEIKDENEWTEWFVLNISDSTFTDPIDSRVLVKAHRRATGDSLPKRNK